MNFLKKATAIVFITFASLPLFALSDFSDSTLSLGIAFPYMSHDYKISGQDSVTIIGTGVRADYRKMIREKDFGFFIDTTIFFPASKTLNISKTESVETNVSDYKYFFGIDLMGGLYKVLFKSSGINVPAGIGIHMDSYISKIEKSRYEIRESTYTMGLGGFINCELNISKKIGIFGGIKLTYDFYAQMRESGAASASRSGKASAFAIEPSAGLAVHF